jgi:surfeit locus 1 family protein
VTGRRGLAVPLAIGALLIAGLLALGTWQVQRRAWKLDLIARVERHLANAPVPAPPAARAEEAYRRVWLSGRFLHDRETKVQALTERGAGFWLLTPLVTDRGTVLVNRGFVPLERVAVSRPAGTVRVTGLLRLSEVGGGFLRTNDPVAGRWYSRDVAAIEQRQGLRLLPYFVDADATPNPGGYPVGGLTVVAFRNHHLVYALTWYALAALTAWAMVLLVRMRRTG